MYVLQAQENFFILALRLKKARAAFLALHMAHTLWSSK